MVVESTVPGGKAMYDLDVSYTPQLRKSVDLRPLADRASAWLTETVGRSLDAVTAEWDVTSGPEGRTFLSVRMKDFAGTSSAAIDPDEFDDPEDVKTRLRAAFQKLLGTRIQTLIAGWGTPGDEGGGDAGEDE